MNLEKITKEVWGKACSHNRVSKRFPNDKHPPSLLDAKLELLLKSLQKLTKKTNIDQT